MTPQKRLTLIGLLFTLILAYYTSSKYLKEQQELNHSIFLLANSSTDSKYYVAYKSVSLPYKRRFISENSTT